MTTKQPYSYTVLRYVHDVMTGEFVNVGVVLHAPDANFLGAKIRTTIGRIKDAFPDLDAGAFRSAVRRVRAAADHAAKEQLASGLFSKGGDAGVFAASVLPRDDSSLQWSPMGFGLAADPQAALDRLYERMVARYDTKQKPRRTEEDVWRPVRQKLEERDLANCLQEKVIQGGRDDIVFNHAWKNGVWHCYEPVSLDLSEADGIKDKARRWLGHLAAVSDGAEAFKTYFIVGAPRDAALEPAYRKALDILQAGPTDVEVYEEGDVDQLVAVIEDEIKAHSEPSHA
jgi:hypothetical protein